MPITQLTGPVFGPASHGKPQQLVVLMHGLGADGDDLIGLAPELARALPDAVFVSPNAPFPCDMAPWGFQWFSLQDRAPAAMEKGVRAVAPTVDAFLDAAMAKYSVPAAKTVLVGFSQGTMTSLHVAPRRAQSLAGVVGFSGALVAGNSLAAEATSKPPICLIHGNADEVVPFAAMGQANTALTNAGFSIETHTRPNLGHGIDGEGIAIAARFLRRVLGVA